MIEYMGTVQVVSWDQAWAILSDLWLSSSWALRAFWEILVNEMYTQPFVESYVNTSRFSSPVNLCKVLLAYSGSWRKEGYIYG